MKHTDETTEREEHIERELIKRLLSHDELAVREFYDRYTPQLFNFIRIKVADERDVEEIAQDTLFGFLEGLRDFAGDCRLNTYLCSIAKHKIIDYYRKKKLKRIVFSQLPPGMEQLLVSIGTPEQSLDQSFVREKIAVVFAHLAPRYVQLLKMKYEEGRSVEEIAHMLSLSFKSVESLLFRARRAFVRLYAQDM